jgi:putative ATP-dependent endonuclease of OLD family
MRLLNLHIRNFRKIEDLPLTFSKGLSVIVGENNAGKTAIIDALRLMLFSSRDFEALRLNEDDFRRDSQNAPIEISCTFCDLSETDEVHFQECLVDIGNGKFHARLNARAEFNDSTRRVNVKMWGGETEGGMLPSNLYDHLSSIYLQPLRDPESGLRPGRHSQVARLIDRLTEVDKRGRFETIAMRANNLIRKLDSVKRAKSDIDTQLTSIAGAELAQETELIFSDPTFHRIIAGLQPEIDGLPFALNGLGYNNLVFTAATLGTLRRSEDYSFRSIIVEEPEAHLHPHLQVLLLRHLVNAAEDNEGTPVQVLVSTHSPILASQAPIDSVISIHESGGRVTGVSLCSINYDGKLKRKLQRFLDATRAELFFARRILMVEGIAEALLLPVLARIAGGDLKHASVTVLNADGINFNAFIPLFENDRLGLAVAILTDGDDADRTGTPSATAKGLKAKESEIPNLRVEFGEVTFEHELARSAALLPFMLTAFRTLRPTLGVDLDSRISKLDSGDEKADVFLSEFLRSKTSKGEFAQELAGVLEESLSDPEADAFSAYCVPTYIRNALEFLGVINANNPDEPDGSS